MNCGKLIVPTGRIKAMQIFQLAPVDPVPPAWVKENASAWMATTWKVEEAYTAVETLVDMFRGAGQFASMIDDLATQGPGVHIKNDVIDQLDGKMHFVVAPGSSESEAPTDDVVISFGVKDRRSAGGT